jgi:hypothetical protein
MRKGCTGLLATGLLTGLMGCHSDRPHEYGQERPPVDRLDRRDAGLQSKDVISASEQMANELLTTVPELHTSTEKWTIAVQSVENYTSDRRQNLNIFINRLGVRLGQLGRRNIQLIENLDRFRDLQSRELDQGARDEFGQGGGAGQPGPTGQNPDFILYAKIDELRNRGTSYYMMDFTLVAVQNTPQHRARERVWSGMYEVKVNN